MTEDNKNDQLLKYELQEPRHDRIKCLKQLIQKRFITVCFEFVGMFLLASGIAYYILFVQLPEPRQKFTEEVLEKIHFHWNVSAIIIITSGILVALGLVILLLSLVTVLISTEKKEITPLSKSPDLRKYCLRFILTRALFILPFLIPITFNFLYQPINENITVKHFGCGCPKIVSDVSYFIDFNANHLNIILWGIVLFISIFLWTNLTTQIERKMVRNWMTFLGIFVLLVLCCRFLALSTWM